jgi:GT2 family glycosyltransferase
MLLFVDADTTVNQAAVRAAIRAMRKGAVGGGCGFRFGGDLPLYGRLLSAGAIPLYRALRVASGCFLFCTRQAFHAVGGFDEKVYRGEEAVMSWRLGRHGRFVVLRETVTTSGRKLRTYSALEFLVLAVRAAFAGPNGIRQRERWEIWYGVRRPDPGPKVHAGKDRQ